MSSLHSGYAAGQLSENKSTSEWPKQKRFWRGLVKVRTQHVTCVGMTLNKLFVFENPLMWLNSNNSTKKIWWRIPPQWCKRLIVSYHKHLTAALPAVRFRGRWLFTYGRVGLEYLFCIYSGYFSLILQLVWWCETCKCDKYTKKGRERNREGGKYFFKALYLSSKKTRGRGNM